MSLAAERAVLAFAPARLFIDGEWIDAADGAEFDVIDPATGERLTSVSDADVEDARAALAAAHRAFEQLRRTPPRQRAEILRRAYETMVDEADRLALLVTLEMGKPLAESRAEVAYAAAYLRWYSEEAVRINGRFGMAEDGAGRILTMEEPVGPCLFITPWNFPLAMITRKVGPAFAAGCPSIVKPAPQTPLSALAIAEILHRAGAPAGTVNVVPSSRSGSIMQPLIEDARLRKLSFTGSTDVGRHLIRQSAQQVLRVSMELGGNAPFLVFADADLDLAVESAMVAKMRNGGEACTSANRFYVHGSLAEAFTDRLTARMQGLRVGRGTVAGVQVGPVIDKRQRTRVAELVDDACARGATVRCGGRAADGPGFFFQPTVLSDVDADARLLSEEIFGPVAPIVPFEREEQAVASANESRYGLVAYVFTRDLDRALRVGERLETGMVGLNQGHVSNVGAPFGGVKHSGFGREGGPEGMRDYLETKYIAMGREHHEH